MRNALPKLIVFDMAGTIVDHGCMAPIVAIREAFAQAGVPISDDQARGPMGLHKRDHIREVLQLEEVASRWNEQHGKPWTQADVQQLYELLVPRQLEIAFDFAELIPGAAECNAWLREQGIRIATTTGYPRSVAAPILDRIRDRGFPVEASCCADEVPQGRPAPWMIFRTMEQLGLYPPAEVLKVGDTVPDMQAARNAGTGGVGLLESSSEMGLAYADLQTLPIAERQARCESIEAKLVAAGATTVVSSVADLPRLLQEAGVAQ